MLEGFHLKVSQIVLKAIEPYGFALGGGYALQVHGIIDRPTKDIDSYVSQADEKLFNDAEIALFKALEDEGLSAVVGYCDSWFRALQVFDPATEEAVIVDLGYDYREKEPVVFTDIGPVLDIRDVITGKVRALWDRQTIRDYIDIDAILHTELWTPKELLTALQSVRPEAMPELFSGVLSMADTFGNEEYEGYGLNQEEIAGLINRLKDAATQVL